MDVIGNKFNQPLNPYFRNMHGFRSYVFWSLGFIVFSTYGSQAFAQNLLPNGDFEHPFISYDLQWKQPHGPYYHYYQDAQQTGSAYEGQFYNGLCMYNHQENEFLQARLSEKLEAGSTYCLSSMARLMEMKAFNHELHDKIGILFSEHPFEVEKPHYCGGKPDVFWLIPDTVNRFDWMALDTAYTASGHEQYITIGYWRDLGYSEKVKDEKFERFMGPDPETSRTASIPPPDFSKKGKKKRNRKGKDEWADFRQQVMEEAHSQGEVIPTTSPGEGLFTLRYYLDNLCVALRQPDGTCDCTIAAQPVDLSQGSIVRMDNLLFATGESTLQPGSDYALEILTLILKENPSMRIAIHGHTDNVGSDEDNLKLSRERAEAVFGYLLKVEVDPARLSFDGFGSMRPVSDNDTPEGRALNRRVEFEVLER